MGDGPDGGSDVSYESVASEGGFEPASERGRDPLPRIIAASHCVEVFRRVYWDAGWNCRAMSPDEKGSAAKAAQDRMGPHDPLTSLPQRLMRFDGAMEAWLEELPPPLDPRNAVPYSSLNEVADRRQDLSILKAGNRRATIWYFTVEFLQQLWPQFVSPEDQGLRLWERALLDRGCNIQSTHVELGRIDCPLGQKGKARQQWLKAVFAAMQSSKWSPSGEARSFLQKRRLTHASMSVGDAIQIGSELYFVSLNGFTPVSEAVALLPPGSFDADEEANADEPEPSAPNGEKKKSKKKRGKGKAKDAEDSDDDSDDEEDDENDGGKANGGKGRRRNRGKGKGGKGGGQDAAPGGGKGGKGKGSKGKDAKGAKDGKGGGKGGAKGGNGDQNVRRADRRALREQCQAERQNARSKE